MSSAKAALESDTRVSCLIFPKHLCFLHPPYITIDSYEFLSCFNSMVNHSGACF